MNSRILTILFICMNVEALHLDANKHFSNDEFYPTNLGWLFDVKRRFVNDKSEAVGSVCVTDECKAIARAIKVNMDKTIDPCDDFYSYVCAKWPENNPVPEGRSVWSLLYIIRDKVNRQVEEILMEQPKADEILPITMAKKYYRSCIDNSNAGKKGLEPLVTVLSKIGGWPMIMDPEEWDEHKFPWQKVDDYYTQLRGKNAFYNVRLLYEEYCTSYVPMIDIPTRPYGSWTLGDERWPDEENNEEEDSQEKGSKESVDQKEGSGQDVNDDEDSKEQGNQEEGSGQSDDRREGSGGDYDDDEDIDVQGEQGNRSGKPNDHREGSGENGDDEQGDQKDDSEQSSDPTEGSGDDIDDDKKSEEQNDQKKSRGKLIKISNNKVGDEDIVFDAEGEENEKEEEKEQKGEKQKEKEKEKKEEKKNPVIIYKNFVTKVALALAEFSGSKVSTERLAADVKDLLIFMQEMMKLFRYSSDDVYMTVDEIQDLYDSQQPSTANGKINWLHKFNVLFANVNITIDRRQKFNVYEHGYLTKLVSLLDRTPSRTIVNYVHWKFISEMLGATTDEMRNLLKTVAGFFVERNKTNSERCLDETKEISVVGYEYVKRYFNDSAIEKAKEMIGNIQNEIKREITECKWLLDDVKTKLLGKIHNISSVIGYPEWYKNMTIINQFSKGMSFSLSYFENILNSKKHQITADLKNLHETEEESEYGFDMESIDPSMVNAYYSLDSNTIAISAADLQDPFYGSKRPPVLNYGLVGLIIGHEISHSFGLDKSVVAGSSKLELLQLEKVYKEKIQCFVDQYDNYANDTLLRLYDRILPNYGVRTFRENLADSMAIDAVFEAYKAEEKKNCKPELTLPGFEEFNDDQLFFLSFASIWCEALSSEAIDNQYTKDSHSPGVLRVIGTVSNSKYFAKAYNCSVGSPMNPEKKCNMWK